MKFIIASLLFSLLLPNAPSRLPPETLNHKVRVFNRNYEKKFKGNEVILIEIKGISDAWHTINREYDQWMRRELSRITQRDQSKKAKAKSQARYKARIFSKIDKDYWRSLNQSFDFLIDHMDQVSVSDLAWIKEDIRLKAENCQTFGLTHKTKVHCRTFSDQTEIDGYEVWFATKGDYEDASTHQRFSELSRTEKERFIPGVYLFWTQKRETKSETSQISVGRGKKKSQQVDLLVE